MIHIPKGGEVQLPNGTILTCIDITPALAQQWIGRSDGENYRKSSQQTIDAYVRDMKNGSWKDIPDPISLDNTGGNEHGGKVIQGMHRLKACVQSGVTLKNIIVVFGVDKNNEVGFDSGKPRRFDDHARYFGKDYRHNELAIAKVLEWGATSHYPKIQPAEAFALVEKYRYGITFAMREQSKSYARAPVVAAIAMAAYYPEHHPRLIEFIHSLHTGKNIYPGDEAVILLRNLMFVECETDVPILFKKATSAVKNYLKGKSISSLIGTEKILFPIYQDSTGKVVADRR